MLYLLSFPLVTLGTFKLSRLKFHYLRHLFDWKMIYAFKPKMTHKRKLYPQMWRREVWISLLCVPWWHKKQGKASFKQRGWYLLSMDALLIPSGRLLLWEWDTYYWNIYQKQTNPLHCTVAEKIQYDYKWYRINFIWSLGIELWFWWFAA